MESRRMVQMNLSAKQKQTGMENKLMNTKDGREGGINWEVGIDT